MRGRTARAATMHSAQRLARSDDDPPLFLFSTMSEVVVPLETQGRPDIATLCNKLTSISDWFTLRLNLGVQHPQLEVVCKDYSVEGLGAWRPDTATLCNELASISDWRKLGLYLGVKDYELDQIETSHPTGGCGRWKQETFSLWLRCTPNASWGDVVGALRRMGQNTEAGRIEQQYIVQPAYASPFISPISLRGTASPFLSPSSAGAASQVFSPGSPFTVTGNGTPSATTPESPSNTGQNRYALAVAQRNIRKIKGKFSTLVTKSRTKLQSKEISIEDVQTFLVTMYSSPNSRDGSDMVTTVVESTRSLDEIFRALGKYGLWDYLNYYLLQSIIEEFGSDDDELNGMMVQYQRDLTGHILTQKIQMHLDAVVTASENSADENVPVSSPQHKHKLFKKLSVKVEANVTDYSLKYVNDLWQSLANQFSLPQPAMILHKVAEGCIGITWLIPANLVKYVTRMAQKTSNVFDERHILRVMLDERCLYPMEAELPLPETEAAALKKKALGMVPQVHRKRKLDDDLETDQPAPKRPIMTSKAGPSKLRAGQADYQSTSAMSQHTFDSSSKVLPTESGGYDCEFVDSPPETLETKCPICHDVPRKPNQTDCCGQIFCETCIEPVQTQTKPCPMCKHTGFATFHDKKLQRALNQLQVRCTYQERGCTWTGKLGKLDSHLNCNDLSSGCEYADIHCKFSYIGCKALMPRKDMITHMEEEQSHHNELLTEKVEEQGREIEELNMKLQMKEEETACTIQQMQEQFTLQLRNKDEEIASVTHKMREISALLQSKDKEIAEKDKEIAHLKQDTKPKPHLHQVNFCFTMNKFKHHRENDITWYSEPFYTHSRGYRICVRIDANGLRDSNFVSLFTCIMKGEYDDELSWPFHGKITVELLNQKTDDHYAYTLSYNESIGPDYLDYANRVLIGEKNHGWGKTKFIPYLKLSEESDSTLYLKDDCLQFRVREVLLYY